MSAASKCFQSDFPYQIISKPADSIFLGNIVINVFETFLFKFYSTALAA